MNDLMSDGKRSSSDYQLARNWALHAIQAMSAELSREGYGEDFLEQWVETQMDQVERRLKREYLESDKIVWCDEHMPKGLPMQSYVELVKIAKSCNKCEAG